MKELEAKLLWQKIQLNSFYGYTGKEFQDILQDRSQTMKKISTIKRRVTKIKNIFPNEI